MKSEKNIVNELQNKKIYIFLLIALVIVLALIYLLLIKPKQETTNNKISEKQVNNTTNKAISVYELNKIGFLKGNSIIEEKYNEENDLIYYETNNSKNTFDYEYDINGNVIAISYTSIFNGKTNNNKLNIYYDNDKIVKIQTSSEAINYEINFEYNNDNITVTKYYDNNFNNQEKHKLSSKYVITSKNINNIEYKIIQQFNNNETKPFNTMICETGNKDRKNILNYLGLLPIAYLDGYNINKRENCNSIDYYTGFDFSYPILNQGKMIYFTQNSIDTDNKYVNLDYDKNGNLLLMSYYNTNSYYYKYNELKNGIKSGSCLTNLGFNQYYESNINYYYNEDGILYKVEIVDEQELNNEKYLELYEKYMDYYSENVNYKSNNIYNEAISKISTRNEQ